MQTITWLAAGIFLPLFPLGMIFNSFFQRIQSPWGRAVLLLSWPLPGIWLVHDLSGASAGLPGWLLLWAVFSALLYGFRAGVVREFGVWTGFLATSAWVLCWVGVAAGLSRQELILHVLAFSLPLALLSFLVNELVRRYQSAYAGIVSGVAQAQPRLSGMLVIVMLAAIGSPLFPAFFTMLDYITHAITDMPVIAFGVVAAWLLWSWSGMRLLQELLVGPSSRKQREDMSLPATTAYGMALLVLVTGGLYLMGEML